MGDTAEVSIIAPGSSSDMLSLWLVFAMEHNNLPTESWECFFQGVDVLMRLNSFVKSLAS